jgi:hypothetical protein
MRNVKVATNFFSLVILISSVTAAGAERRETPGESQREARPIALTSLGKPKCAVVTSAAMNAPLADRAVESIVSTVRAWGAAELPVTRLKPGESIPAGTCVVLTTLDDLRQLAPEVLREAPEFAHIESTDSHGFAIAPVDDRVFVVSLSPRGVYNGAVYLREFLIEGTNDELSVAPVAVRREPILPRRVAYTSNIWGNDPEYTVADWNTVFQAYARDGVETNYFWVSGHFPSKKFPQTYRWVDGVWDSAANTRIGTVEDLQAIIRLVHENGMTCYLGGALGAWTGTGNITHQKPGTMKTGAGDAPGSLCPSHPESRTALIEYYDEIFDALPEADGLYIEMADEWGECVCPECSKPLDAFGSKQFGKSQLTLAQEIADRIWSKHPHVKFSLTLGYDEHAHDPMFYQMVREMGDEHYEWMEARDRWAFSGPEGKDLPAAHFSGHVLKWKQWYAHPLPLLVDESNRTAREGLHGMINAFEPGFASGSIYTTIPFPLDSLTYLSTWFAFREMTWEPSLSLEELKERSRRRFFGSDGGAELVDDFWALRELMRVAPVEAPWRQGGAASEKGTLSVEQVSELARIDAAIDAAWPAAGPKSREGMQMMRKTIADLRSHFDVPAH